MIACSEPYFGDRPDDIHFIEQEPLFSVDDEHGLLQLLAGEGAGFIASVIVAIILLVIYGKIKGRTSS